MSGQPQTPAGGVRPLAARGALAIEAARLEIAAAMGLGFLAALFVTQPESWPVFLAWCDQQPTDEPFQLRDREMALRLVECLQAGSLVVSR